jgi:hypothetical protein
MLLVAGLSAQWSGGVREPHQGSATGLFLSPFNLFPSSSLSTAIR